MTAEEFFNDNHDITKRGNNAISNQDCIELMKAYADQVSQQAVVEALDTLVYVHKTLLDSANRTMIGSVIKDLENRVKPKYEPNK